MKKTEPETHPSSNYPGQRGSLRNRETAAILYSTVPKDSAGLFLRRKILVVEDSPESQMLIQRWLKKTGAQVDAASNGQEAIHLAIRNNYDLIVMDIQMPLMNGYESVKTLRQQNFTIPIIALTASNSGPDREHAIESGFTDFLEKPIRIDQLFEALRKYLKK